MRDVISIASGPETRIHPIAPPWAVAMAQIVSWFIISSLFYLAKIVVSLNLMFNAIKNTSKRTYYIGKDYLKEICNGRVEELSTR